jgi:hypothetical protein
VCHFLLKAAQESEMNGVPLADRLFVPKAVEQAPPTSASANGLRFWGGQIWMLIDSLEQLVKPHLPPRLIHHHRHRIGQVQATTT